MPELYNQPNSKGIFSKEEKSNGLERKKAIINTDKEKSN